MARRQHLTLMLMAGAAIFFTLTYFMSTGPSRADPFTPSAFDYKTSPGSSSGSTPMGAVDFGGLDTILSGGSIAPKLGNETLKYV